MPIDKITLLSKKSLFDTTNLTRAETARRRTDNFVRQVSTSDDFADGNYVFKVVNGQAQDAVFYWNQDGGESATGFNNVIDFVARYAYEPA